MNEKKRFDRHWKENKLSGCWEWCGARHRQGYGHFRVAGETVLAHRFAWKLYRGQTLPPERRVCHKCDNPPCVNPEHLFVGTQRDNVIDCIAKGRANRPHRLGSDSPRALLTDYQVRRILRDTRKYQVIADEYGRSVSTIGMIKRGCNWRHLFTEWNSEEANKRTEARL